MTKQTPSLSFEVFPPNPEVGNAKLLRALENMQELAPHFISVTASNNKYNIKETTVALANHIQNELSIPTIAHLPAIYLSKEKVADTLHELDQVGVHRILALRGDIIPGIEQFFLCYRASLGSSACLIALYEQLLPLLQDGSSFLSFL